MGSSVRGTLRRYWVLVYVFCGVGWAVVAPSPTAAAHPGENGLIVYVELVDAHDEYGSRAPEIFVAEPDGSNPRRLTFDGGYPAIQPGATDYELTGSWAPVWSPDGQWIAFAHRDEDRNISLETMRSDGTERTTMDEDVFGGDFIWSPDGRHVAYGYSPMTSEQGIWVAALDGSGAQLLLPVSSSSDDGFWAIGDLDWSPTGAELAFTGRQTGVSGKQLYAIHTDGSGLRRLQCADDWVVGASWSPDGHWIATSCGGALYRVAADGNSYEALATGLTTQEPPVWSPDGSQILYASDSTGSGGLWSYDVDTETSSFLTDFTGTQLDWQPVVRFTDVVGNVFRGDIEWLAAQGITRGCNPPGDDLFCPDGSVTRGQMAAFLVRALGYSDDGGGDPFADDDTSIFRADIEKLAAAGVTKGCNPPVNDMFCPNEAVTRGQMAAFLVRALGYSDDGGGNLFVDDDGSVFEADIERLAEAGVTKGCNPPTNDRFCPDEEVTRGQMAAFLHRALGTP